MSRYNRSRTHGYKHAGMTLVEMLIALGILAAVLLLTSSGIIQGLFVNRLQEEATNTQSKLRRITEVVAQDLRSAVLGGITNYPVEADSNGISFALLAGDGGFSVIYDDDYGVSEYTGVYSSDASALDALVGSPAVVLNGNGDAVVIPEITSVSSTQIRHSDCQVSIAYDPATRVFGASALGFDFDPDEGVLYQVLVDSDGSSLFPFAFDLSRFEIAYEYVGDETPVVRTTPWTDGNGNPQPSYESGGVVYELSRLRMTLATNDEGGEVAREYVGYVELTGLGNSWRPVKNISACGDPIVGGGDDDGGGGDDGGDDGGGDDGGGPGDGDDDGGDDGGGDGGGDDGGGPGGGGDDDDDDCPKWNPFC